MKYEIRHWLLLSYWKVIFKVLFLLFLSNFIFVSYFSVGSFPYKFIVE